VLNRFTSRWEALPTSIIKYDSKSVNYRAVSKGFSYFAITASKKAVCIEDWVCGNWSACSVSGTQVRTCKENNNCSWAKNKPEEGQFCTYIKPVIEQPVEETANEAPKEADLFWWAVGGAGLLLQYLSGQLLFSLKKCSGRMKYLPRKGKKSRCISTTALKQGISREEIKKRLMEKGWSKEQVDKLFNVYGK